MHVFTRFRSRNWLQWDFPPDKGAFNLELAFFVVLARFFSFFLICNFGKIHTGGTERPAAVIM